MHLKSEVTREYIYQSRSTYSGGIHASSRWDICNLVNQTSRKFLLLKLLELEIGILIILNFWMWLVPNEWFATFDCNLTDFKAHLCSFKRILRSKPLLSSHVLKLHPRTIRACWSTKTCRFYILAAGSSAIGSITVYETVDGRRPLSARAADPTSNGGRGVFKRLLKFKRLTKLVISVYRWLHKRNLCIAFISSRN